MYICLCNPFTDKDVQEHLGDTGKTTVKEVYAACSGGESMNCCSCACEMKAIVDTHNNALTINALSDQMQKIADTTKEPVS